MKPRGDGGAADGKKCRRSWGAAPALPFSAAGRRADAGAGCGPVVPVEFLADGRAGAYGTFTEVPTRPEPDENGER